jgi:FkbM family methyltransferase
MAGSLFWSLRGLGRLRWLHRVTRVGMRLFFPHGKSRTIWAGPLRGWRWRCHRDHQFWMPLGLYEAETAAWLMGNLAVGSVCYDVGANAGYFTLLASKCVGAAGRVIAFEPIPSNIAVIEGHLTLNGRTNTVVEPLAISNREGAATFAVEARNANSHLSAVDITHAVSAPEAEIEVETMTLDTYVERSGVRPDLLKIDVEGAEALVLQGASRLLAEIGPQVVVSTHSAALHTRCCELLASHGYTFSPLPGFEHEIIAYRPGAGGPGDGVSPA